MIEAINSLFECIVTAFFVVLIIHGLGHLGFLPKIMIVIEQTEEEIEQDKEDKL